MAAIYFIVTLLLFAVMGGAWAIVEALHAVANAIRERR